MHARGSLRSWVSTIVVVGMVATGLGVASAAPATAADAMVALTKEGPGAILVGGEGQFTLTAANAGTTPAYNISFRDVLPEGVSYSAGSTSPSSVGEPRVLPGKPAAGQTTLIWDNVFDVNPAGTGTLTYGVTVSATDLPVGTRFTNTATSFSSADPRVAPSFDAGGAFVPEDGVSAGPDLSETTDITAIEVRKSEPSPENELVRGIHGDEGTTYSIRVTNNGVNPTSDVTVSDLLPASLEFLQCGGVDNSEDTSFVEYPGAPRLTATTAPGGNCLTPTAVETVVNPPGRDAGVYTKVTWQIGQPLDPGAEYTITYRAGVPLQQNTATFASRPSGSPDLSPAAQCTDDSCPQAANLDNNTGASTVEKAVEDSATNDVEASGYYQGAGVDQNGDPVDGPIPVIATDRETVTIEDLAMDKSVSPSTFTTGGTATYRIRLRTSEYRSAESIVVRDVLPDGLTYVDGSVSGATLQSATRNGATTLVFEVPDVAASDERVFTYRASMDAAYESTGLPTVAGDDYTNDVSLSGSTAPIEAVDPSTWDESPEPGTLVFVRDHSNATITSGGSTVAKTIGQDRTSSDCDQSYAATTPATPFVLGDIVCFDLKVTFNAGSSTRDAFVQDFLPAELAYVPDSMTALPDSTIPEEDLQFDESDRSLTWLIGAEDGGSRYVAPGAVFHVRFSAVVVSDTVGVAPDVTGNLMKFGSTNTAGQATTARDRVDVNLAGSLVGIRKGVSRIVAELGSATFTPPKDGPSVKAADQVTFTVDVSNIGAEDVRNLVVADDLFDGITCADVSAISDGGTCGDGSGAATGRITWTVTDDSPLAPKAKRSFTYVVTIPDDVRVNTRFDDTAIVTSYETVSNAQTWDTVFPKDVKDPSWVATPNATVAKSGVTGFTDLPNNNRPNQFTEGETITYTVDVRIPAGTTVAPGSTLSDTLPEQLGLLRVPLAEDPVVLFSATNDPQATDPLPVGTVVKVDRTGGRDRVRVSLPAGYAVPASSTTSHLFRLVFTAVLLPSAVAEGDQGKRITNSASFTGARSQSYDAFVVLPNPQLTKTNSAGQASVTPGTPVTYTLTAANPSAAASLRHTPLYAAVITDVVPDDVIVDPASITTPAGVTCESAGLVPAGGGSLVCDLGTLDSDEVVVVTYKAAVKAGALGSRVYVNEAQLTGTTLPADEVVAPQYEVTYTRTDSSVIRTDDGALRKAVDPAVASVGQRVTWVVTWQTGDASFASPTLVDTLPTVGGQVAVSGVEAQDVTCSPGCADVTWSADTSDPATVVWRSAGTVPAATSVEFTYSGVVSDVPGTIAGEVLVNSARLNQGPPAQAALLVVEPDLSITKAAEADAPAPGAPFTYTVTVSNAPNAAGDNGPVGTAYRVPLVDSVPVGVIVDVDSLTDGATCADCDPSAGGGTITWPNVGPITPGASVTRTYEARLDPAITEGEYLNVVTATYASCDPDDAPEGVECVTTGRPYGPIDASVVITPGPASADLSVVKTPNGATTAGSEWTFTMQVRNNGPSDAEGAIVVTDRLPDGLAFVSSGPGWECLPIAQVITCTLRPLAPEPVGLRADEDAAPLAITVRTANDPTTASYTNVAEVESTTTPDPKPENNRSSATVSVSPIPGPPDPDKPVDPDRPVDPDKPVDPVDPGNPTDPTDPNRPTVQPQKPVTPLPIPQTLEPLRPTVVLPAGVLTNADQPVRASVQCRPLYRWTDKVALTLGGAWVPAGDVRFCDVRTSGDGKVTVTSLYRGQLLVKVTYTADKVPGFTAFTKVKRWVVTPR